MKIRVANVRYYDVEPFLYSIGRVRQNSLARYYRGLQGGFRYIIGVYQTSEFYLCITRGLSYPSFLLLTCTNILLSHRCRPEAFLCPESYDTNSPPPSTQKTVPKRANFFPRSAYSFSQTNLCSTLCNIVIPRATMQLSF